MKTQSNRLTFSQQFFIATMLFGLFFGAGNLIFPIFLGSHALPARAADGQLHRHYGDAHNDEEQQIKEDEIPAAVLTGQIRELPYVSDADGTSGAHKNEPDARIEILSLHFLPNSHGRMLNIGIIPCPSI